MHKKGMKFGKRLEASLIPEWRDKYIGYKELKDQIKLVKRDRDRLVKLALESGYEMPNGWPSEHEIFKLKAAKDYFDLQLQYLRSIEQFYLEQINRATERFYILTEQLIQLVTFPPTLVIKFALLYSVHPPFTAARNLF